MSVVTASAGWSPGTGGRGRRPGPVARQRIQRLANQLAEQGRVEFVDNPAHRRSKLVRLTAKGETTVDEISKRLAEWTDQLAAGMDEREIRTALKVIRELRRRVEGFLR